MAGGRGAVASRAALIPARGPPRRALARALARAAPPSSLYWGLVKGAAAAKAGARGRGRRPEDVQSDKYIVSRLAARSGLGNGGGGIENEALSFPFNSRGVPITHVCYNSSLPLGSLGKLEEKKMPESYGKT